MNPITQEMADDLNAELVKIGSAYRIIKSEGNDYSYEININKDPFERHRPMIYPNQEFFGILERHFRKYGIVITYNNTRSTFWTDAR
ncbi:hypothetical protein [Cohnella sp. AR92]|uniref:hypothetical protein n=1 Tax=Cohnella sp. AR92 TaxID=648716 RepID=UPI000F8D4398|nr:hypothetical protein [Cohnella sp. AR92]RUS42239.1 hypothetical protein ELR57_26870 [Cohnella sp. AR92]RUS47545.1 hypothetical protein ELR57_07030 [Cohnella sp. AR92]